jgi:hypothetical protein
MTITSKQAILVTVNISGNQIHTTNVITIKQEVIKTSINKLSELIDVDATSEDDGDSIVYDADTDKYIVEKINSNNVVGDYDGGEF